jgi:ribosomal-protein-alanine acetyltransferase
MRVRDITLREAPPAFAALLAALHARAFAEPWATSAFATLLEAPGVSALMAVDGTPSGEVPLGFILTRLAADEAEILTLAVEPEERGKGIGRRLIQEALDFLRARGARAVFLEVGLANVPARRLYERAGFTGVGRRRGYYRNSTGLNEDAVMLRCAL